MTSCLKGDCCRSTEQKNTMLIYSFKGLRYKSQWDSTSGTVESSICYNHQSLQTLTAGFPQVIAESSTSVSQHFISQGMFVLGKQLTRYLWHFYVESCPPIDPRGNRTDGISPLKRYIKNAVITIPSINICQIETLACRPDNPKPQGGRREPVPRVGLWPTCEICGGHGPMPSLLYKQSLKWQLRCCNN